MHSHVTRNPSIISIHALRKESDYSHRFIVRGFWRFQSTLSVRRATRSPCSRTTCHPISIHALRKESDGYGEVVDLDAVISIHALRKESDPRATRSTTSSRRFQSTLSVRRATVLPSFHLTSVTFQSTLSVRRATPE